MFEVTLRQMSSMPLRGATDDQIIWRLRTAGVRIDASELLQGLTRLSERGEIIIDERGRWKLAEFAEPAPKTTAPDDSDRTPASAEILRAVEAACPQAKVIALDYTMRGGKAKIKARRALLFYALRRLELDTDPGARKPQDQQIVLLSTEVIHEDHG